MSFLLEDKNNIGLVTFPLFTSTGLVTHGFTTRGGGVSEGVYTSLNMGFGVGDSEENVLVNRRLVSAALGVDPDALVAGKQVHGKNVAVVDERDRGRGARNGAQAIEASDILLTSAKGVILSSFYADCVPLYFLDPVKKVIALAHAGWRGTVQKVGMVAVQSLAKYYASNPADLLAVIGPSIGGCCYEVDARVQEEFKQAFDDWPQFFTSCGNDRWLLDLPRANRLTLAASGLRPESIVVAGLCTACRQDLFFSYRASSGRTGRMASLLMLR